MDMQMTGSPRTSTGTPTYRRRPRFPGRPPGIWVLRTMLAVLLLISISAFPARKCECKDIERVKNVLNQVKGLASAFRTILAATYSSGGPANTDDMYAQAYAIVGMTVTKKAGGVSGSGEPYVDPGVENRECDIVVNAVRLHEMYHRNHLTKKVLFPALFAFTDKAKARLMASSEVGAYEIEQEYLEQALEQLKDECRGNWHCKCNNQWYKTAGECAANCPRATIACIAPTCWEYDRETGKPTGRKY
jgi:hypothetical protein